MVSSITKLFSSKFMLCAQHSRRPLSGKQIFFFAIILGHTSWIFEWTIWSLNSIKTISKLIIPTLHLNKSNILLLPLSYTGYSSLFCTYIECTLGWMYILIVILITSYIIVLEKDLPKRCGKAIKSVETLHYTRM